MHTIFQPAQCDEALLQVKSFFDGKTDFLEVVGKAIRKSFDEVIDGPRTGRYRIDQLEKTEKTYIGTKVEIVLRSELGLQRGKVLDNLILGHEVDTKFTVGANWMIPQEALNHLCLLVAGSDEKSIFSIGLLRAVPEVLTAGLNRDGKRSVSAFGKQQILWLAQGEMPKNFMLELSAFDRELIMSAPSGVQAIRTLFRRATGRIIPRSVIEQVAQQKDPAKRAREAKAFLLKEGVHVMCAKYKEDRKDMEAYGFSGFEEDDWLSVRL